MASYFISKDIMNKITMQLLDIDTITENTDRDLSSAETLRLVEALNEPYARQLRENMRRSAETDEPDATIPFIIIGCTVVVHDADSGETVDYHIVNTNSFTLESNDVTFTSPIGKALLFKHVGDTVEIKVPVGKITYIIHSITLDPDISIDKESVVSSDNQYA